MVSLGNGIPGNRSGAYFFEDDSDEPNASDLSPLVRRPPSQAPAQSQHSHIITGYLSTVEAIILVVYTASLLVLSILKGDYKSTNSSLLSEESSKCTKPDSDQIVACFCMVHVALWMIVGIMDRVVQWQHQVLRRKGYLKFYRKMRNVRRIPFLTVSIGNAAQLVFVSVLYFFHLNQSERSTGVLRPVEILYIIVGLEMIVALPCLVYYIVRATMFNYAKQPPDVIQDTFSASNSPTNSVTAVGFRDGEDLDELLERQADMIRYLQQHNANLGRRILELQAQAME